MRWILGKWSRISLNKKTDIVHELISKHYGLAERNRSLYVVLPIMISTFLQCINDTHRKLTTSTRYYDRRSLLVAQMVAYAPDMHCSIQRRTGFGLCTYATGKLERRRHAESVWAVPIAKLIYVAVSIYSTLALGKWRIAYTHYAHTMPFHQRLKALRLLGPCKRFRTIGHLRRRRVSISLGLMRSIDQAKKMCFW